MTTWIALFSHSGYELSEVIKEFKTPHFIYTNQLTKSRIVEILRNESINLYHEDIMEDLLYIIQNTKGKKIITLHGYMRIIPPEIINQPDVEIYNVHPGDILNYPELRGKDPQKKALDMRIASTGVVIHRVDEGIDTGEIVDRRFYSIPLNMSLNALVRDLRLISIDMWVKLLKQVL